MNKEFNILKFEIHPPPKTYAKDCKITFEKVGSLLKGRVKIGVHHAPECKWSYSLPLEMIQKRLQE